MTGLLAIVAIWALAEAVLFFVVADIPIMALAIRHGWRKGLAAALAASLFAAMGGLATMVWAQSDPVGSRALIESLPGISPALFDSAAADWHEGGWRAMLMGSFGGVPYKLYAHAAGVGEAGMAGFAIASIAARLPRFALVALAAGTIGPVLRQRFGERSVWIAFILAWIIFYAVYWSAMAG